MRALNHTYPRELELTIKETQDHPQARTYPLRPLEITHLRRTQLHEDPFQRVVTDLQQTIFTIAEQVIKGLP